MGVCVLPAVEVPLHEVLAQALQQHQERVQLLRREQRQDVKIVALHGLRRGNTPGYSRDKKATSLELLHKCSLHNANMCDGQRRRI